MRDATREELEDEVNAGRGMQKLKRLFLDDFFDSKIQEFFTEFQNVEVGDTESLIKLHTQMKSMIALQHEITCVMDSAKMANAQLKELDKRN